jgi:hypothetical protein
MPVRDLEDWFIEKLKTSFIDFQQVFITLGYEGAEESELVPLSHIVIKYLSYTSNDTTASVFRQGFVFEIQYQAHGPAGLNPHHDALAMAEKGRLALWQQIPPRPSNAFPLKLKSEKILKAKDCKCKPGFSQIWECLNEVPRTIAVFPDACQGAGEPDSTIRTPLDSITPFNAEWYYATNSLYDASLESSSGTNQPWVQDTVTSPWVVNPTFDINFPVKWGNIPVILKPYFKKLNLGVQSYGAH